MSDTILGRYTEVKKVKTKWRVSLKDCIASLNGQEYMLSKVTGEMRF